MKRNFWPWHICWIYTSNWERFTIGTINHWFPLIRPAIRALFLGGVALGGYLRFPWYVTCFKMLGIHITEPLLKLGRSNQPWSKEKQMLIRPLRLKQHIHELAKRLNVAGPKQTSTKSSEKFDVCSTMITYNMTVRYSRIYSHCNKLFPYICCIGNTSHLHTTASEEELNACFVCLKTPPIGWGPMMFT